MRKVILAAIILGSLVGCTKLSLDQEQTSPKQEQTQKDTTKVRKGINIIKMNPAPIYA